MPSYRVIEIELGKQVAGGVLKEVGRCKNAGDFVYRIDLSNVSAGGPYKIVVEGIGCSFPFGVNQENYFSHDDWRLPNAKELQSIIDYTRSPDTTKSAAFDLAFDRPQLSHFVR